MGRSTRVNEFRTLEKHGVSFGEASSVFLDPYFRATDDPSANDRFIALGVSRLARLLFVVHLERGEKVRNIGMSQKRIEVALGQRPLLGRLNGRVESRSAIAPNLCNCRARDRSRPRGGGLWVDGSRTPFSQAHVASSRAPSFLRLCRK